MTDIERTNTVYDLLGRAMQQVQPSFSSYIDEMAAVLSVTNTFLNVGPLVNGGSGTTTVKLDWSSLATWGAGEVLVVIEYTTTNGTNTANQVAQQTFNGYDALHGASLGLAVSTGYTPSITGITVSKKINGQDVVVLTSNGTDTLDTTVTWAAPVVVGVRAVLQYRPAGSIGAWTSVNSDDTGGITLSNGFYRLSLANAANDQYEYQLNYTRAGEGTPYINGAGRFTITSHSSVSSQHSAGWVEEPVLNVTTTTLNTAKTLYSTVLDWSALTNWGSGDVTVTLGYTLKNASNVTTTVSRPPIRQPPPSPFHSFFNKSSTVR